MSDSPPAGGGSAGRSVLLQFLSDNSNPKRRMETAVLDEDADTMRDLVTSGRVGVNEELTSQSALTAMHLACRSDRPNSVRALAQLGADPMVTNFLHQTPLSCALGAKSPRALLELSRWAPVSWESVRTTFRSSLAQEQKMDPYVSFTMHLLVALMQPVTRADCHIVCECLSAYASLVEASTKWCVERVEPPLKPTRALFPDETERAAVETRYVSESPLLLDPLMCPEAFLSALLGTYNCSGLEAALTSLGAGRHQIESAGSALRRLCDTRAAVRDPSAYARPQLLAFACRNVVRRALASAHNYVHAIHRLPLDFSTKAFLTYSREVASVMAARPRTRYTGM